MFRSRSVIPYDILHGINHSPNISAILAYLSYFPPPPPVLPGPPPQRSWTCSARSTSPSSCFISDDLNPPDLRQYSPTIGSNQSFLSSTTSHLITSTSSALQGKSLFDFFRNQLTFILLLIIFLSICVFVIFFLLLFLYIQRKRRRELTSSNHAATNNNNFELNNNIKDENFYYRLIPYREKHRKRSTTLINPTSGKHLLRLSNHDSPVLEVKRLSGTHLNKTNEQEEAL